MKKFYSIAAMTLAVSMTATAAIPSGSTGLSIANAQLQDKVVTVSDMNVLPSNKLAKKEGSKKVEKVSDLYGAYEWSYYGNLSNNSGEGKMSCVLQEGDTPNQIVALGMPYSDIAVVGTVDLAKMTITFATQGTGVPYDNDGTTEEIYFQPGTISNGKWIGGRNIVAEIDDDGVITFEPDKTWSLVILSGGYFWMSQANVLTPPVYFTYDASEWEDAGVCTFEDGFFNPILNTPVPAYEVPIQKNKANPNLILLNCPYNLGEWEGFNMGKGPGYIVLNCEHKEFVRCMPLVGSGMSIDVTSDVPTEIYCFNQEAYYMDIQGWEFEDAFDEMEGAGYDLSNVEGNMITIYNLYFGTSENPLAGYTWVDDNRDPIESECYISIPENLFAGVATVDADNNVPAKYFNLQGMEVKNPAKGEVVIVKKGSKSFKQIAR